MSAREELVAEITDVLNAAISESEYDTEWAESVVGCLLNAHPARLLRAMAEMSWLTDDAAEVDRLRSVLAVRDQEIEDRDKRIAQAEEVMRSMADHDCEDCLEAYDEYASAFLAGLDVQEAGQP